MGCEWVHYEGGESWEEFLNEAKLVGEEGRVKEFKGPRKRLGLVESVFEVRPCQVNRVQMGRCLSSKMNRDIKQLVKET